MPVCVTWLCFDFCAPGARTRGGWVEEVEGGSQVPHFVRRARRGSLRAFRASVEQRGWACLRGLGARSTRGRRSVAWLGGGDVMTHMQAPATVSL